jgi:hypothetical protein
VEADKPVQGGVWEGVAVREETNTARAEHED